MLNLINNIACNLLTQFYWVNIVYHFFSVGSSLGLAWTMSIFTSQRDTMTQWSEHTSISPRALYNDSVILKDAHFICSLMWTTLVYLGFHIFCETAVWDVRCLQIRWDRTSLSRCDTPQKSSRLIVFMKTVQRFTSRGAASYRDVILGWFIYTG